MIVRYKGRLTDINADSVVLDRDGTAREILVPQYALAELAACHGEDVTLHTLEFLEGGHAGSQVIPRMIGFLHAEDRMFFERFTNVNGVGPKKALKALVEPVRHIAAWIEAGDTKALGRLPGIGPRASQMIVAALQGKMTDLILADADSGRPRVVKFSQAQSDAIEVLVAWGDSRNDAEKWLSRAEQLHPEVSSTDDWVRVAYRVKSGTEG